MPLTYSASACWVLPACRTLPRCWESEFPILLRKSCYFSLAIATSKPKSQLQTPFFCQWNCTSNHASQSQPIRGSSKPVKVSQQQIHASNHVAIAKGVMSLNTSASEVHQFLNFVFSKTLHKVDSLLFSEDQHLISEALPCLSKQSIQLSDPAIELQHSTVLKDTQMSHHSGLCISPMLLACSQQTGIC